MRLSISARIFGGFLVLLLLFAGVMGYMFLRMQRLSQDLQLLNHSYLMQALALAQVETIQRNLLFVVAERSEGRATSKLLRRQLRLARGHRLGFVKGILRWVARGDEMNPGARDRQFMQQVKAQMKELDKAFRENEAMFDELFGEEDPTRQPDVVKVGQALWRIEHKLKMKINLLQTEMRRQIRAAEQQVKEEEYRSFLVILVMVVAALLVGVAVTFGVQLTLRPLKTLVAGTKRIGSGDYAHRVEVRANNELGALAREFNHMAGAIEEREQRLIRSERMATAGRIAAHVTHEIRNPLSSISLNTELLEEELDLMQGEQASETRSLLMAIRNEVDRLTDLTEEYLRFARLPRPRLAREDVAEILMDLLAFMTGDLEKHGVQVVQRLSASNTTVLADENQLRQAFLNLVRNAGEAMAGSGGTFTAAMENPDPRWVEVRLTDTGTGIDADHLAKIFEPFFSTKDSGTGLGLALTHQIILEHNGTIEVQSGPGEGTTFVIRLPLAS